MSAWLKRNVRVVIVLPALALAPVRASACSVCFGEPGSSMTTALFWGVIFLLAVVLSVLGGIAGFFVYIARRASRPKGGAATIQPSEG